MKKSGAGSCSFPLFTAALLLLLLYPADPLSAQSTAGMISSVVQDSQGGVVPNARVTLINQAQGAVVRELDTSMEGTFVITPVPPGTYTLTIEATGFKKWIKQDITLFANDRIAIPPIILEVGTSNETVTVEAGTVQIQTVSADRSAVLTEKQMLNLALATRDWTGLLRTMAGTIADPTGGTALPSVNGLREDSNSYSVDGVTVMDTGSNNMAQFRVNTDAIAEFKVVSNSQQAEFGRSAGANITLVTKGGTQEFHGTGYWFHRHEGLNANTFINNYNKKDRALYRYNTQGFNIGGPAYIPGKFNARKDKLFFFVAMEWQRQLTPVSPYFVTVPTAAERKGDFALTHEADGRLVTIRDPLTGKAFPGNQIPQNRWNTTGAKILNFYPLPNIADDPAYNYVSQVSSKSPLDDQIIRIDYNLSERWRPTFRYIRNKRNGENSYTALNTDNNLGMSPFFQPNGADSIMASLTTIITNRLTNEFIYGRSKNYLPVVTPDDSAYLNTNAKLNIPLLFPSANSADLIPNMVFGIPNSPSTNFRGQPYANENPTVNITDNVSWVFSKHTLKFGLFMEFSRKTQSAGSANNGAFDFTRDTANPNDTNWGLSNALLGTFKTASQANIYRVGNLQSNSYEWFLQDNWRVSSNLTLDYGVRFAIMTPTYDYVLPLSGFNKSAWDPAKEVVLYEKAKDSTGKIVSRNPITGQTGPAVLVGAIVPGYGDMNNGLVTEEQKGYPRGLVDSRGVHWGPRFGFAWTPWGTRRKTVIRSGGGVFYEKIRSGVQLGQLSNPPTVQVPQVFYGNLDTYASSTQTYFPVTTSGLSQDGHIPTTYNFNLTLQHELPYGVLLDIAYVGSVSNHQYSTTLLNEPPFGSAWLPENQDPTVTPKYDGTTTLPVNFSRPYTGFGSISPRSFGDNSNYSGLQISANRRMSKNGQFGVAYTWSKALGTSMGLAYSEIYPAHPTNVRAANYGPLPIDRTQILNLNYMYDLPSPIRSGSFLDNSFGHVILDGWQISGITTFSSGVPGNVTYTVSGTSAAALNRMITGSETQAPRVVITGQPNLSPGDRTLDQFINTAVFKPAPKGSIGIDSGPNGIRGPGINNWDISIFKKIALGADRQRYLQIRMEMFNAFNHTQWSNFNRTVNFDATGKVTNLPTSVGGGGGRFGFGALNTVRNARVIQFATKLYF